MNENPGGPPANQGDQGVENLLHEIEKRVSRIEASSATTSDAGHAGLPRGRFWKPTAMLVVILVTGLTWALWPRDVEIPDGMLGLWTTDEPAYADRSFRFTTTTLTIHTGPLDSIVHPIARVTAKGDESGAAYTVYYSYFGEQYEFQFEYGELPEPTIKLLNQQEMTWTKQPS